MMRVVEMMVMRKSSTLIVVNWLMMRMVTMMRFVKMVIMRKRELSTLIVVNWLDNWLTLACNSDTSSSNS